MRTTPARMTTTSVLVVASDDEEPDVCAASDSQRLRSTAHYIAQRAGPRRGRCRRLHKRQIPRARSVATGDLTLVRWSAPSPHCVHAMFPTSASGDRVVHHWTGRPAAVDRTAKRVRREVNPISSTSSSPMSTATSSLMLVGTSSSSSAMSSTSSSTRLARALQRVASELELPPALRTLPRASHVITQPTLPSSPPPPQRRRATLSRAASMPIASLLTATHDDPDTVSPLAARARRRASSEPLLAPASPAVRLFESVPCASPATTSRSLSPCFSLYAPDLSPRRSLHQHMPVSPCASQCASPQAQEPSPSLSPSSMDVVLAPNVAPITCTPRVANHNIHAIHTHSTAHSTEKLWSPASNDILHRWATGRPALLPSLTANPFLA